MTGSDAERRSRVGNEDRIQLPALPQPWHGPDEVRNVIECVGAERMPDVEIRIPVIALQAVVIFRLVIARPGYVVTRVSQRVSQLSRQSVEPARAQRSLE